MFLHIIFFSSLRIVREKKGKVQQLKDAVKHLVAVMDRVEGGGREGGGREGGLAGGGAR